MAKKNSTQQTTAAVVAAVPTVNNGGLKFGMEMDFRIDKNDLVNLAVSQAEESLIVKREENEVRLRDAVRDHERTVQRLKDLAQAQLDGFEMDSETRQLLQLLQLKTGHAHVVKILNTSATSYGFYHRSKEEKEADKPDVDVKKLAIVGSAKVFKRRGDDNYNSEILAWEVNIPFTAEMKEVVEQIKDKAEAVQRIKDELAQINRLVFDLPRLKNRALRELTIAVAEGRVQTMADATNIVLGTQSKALPEYMPVRALPGGVTATATASVSVGQSDDDED